MCVCVCVCVRVCPGMGLLAETKILLQVTESNRENVQLPNVGMLHEACPRTWVFSRPYSPFTVRIGAL